MLRILVSEYYGRYDLSNKRKYIRSERPKDKRLATYDIDDKRNTGKDKEDNKR